MANRPSPPDNETPPPVLPRRGRWLAGGCLLALVLAPFGFVFGHAFAEAQLGRRIVSQQVALLGEALAADAAKDNQFHAWVTELAKMGEGKHAWTMLKGTGTTWLDASPSPPVPFPEPLRALDEWASYAHLSVDRQGSSARSPELATRIRLHLRGKRGTSIDLHITNGYLDHPPPTPSAYHAAPSFEPLRWPETERTLTLVPGLILTYRIHTRR